MSKRKFYQKKRVMIPVIIGLALIFLGIFGAIFSSFYLTTSNAYVDDYQYFLTSKTDGKILQVNVENGAEVKRGELLIRLENDKDIDDIVNSEKELNKAQDELARLEDEINKIKAMSKLAEKNIKDAESNLKNANYDYTRYANEFKDGTVTKKDLNKAVLNLETAQNQFEQAQQQLNLAKEKLNKTLAKKDNQTDELEELSEELEEAKLNLSYAMVTSPRNGVVSEITLQAGDFVKKGERLASITSDKCYVMAKFKKMHADDLKLEQKASIKIYTLDFKIFEGEIVEIMPEKSNLIPVKIKITNDIGKCKIKNNSRAYVKIKVK
ncbi:HlyD family secretion protein [bacterium]|nr:HlyD family secretion protein [bacterium]